MRVRTWCCVLAVASMVGAVVAAPAHAERQDQKKPKFTGDPVKVVYIGEIDVAALGAKQPQWPAAVRARAKAINKAGGIEDASGETHKVEVMVCNTNFDPNTATTCARDAVEQGAVAAVGNNTAVSGQTLPVFEEAGMASIGELILSPTDGSSKVSFPIGSGIPGVFGALPQILARDGAEKVSYVVSDIGATTDAALIFMDQGLGLTDAAKGEVVKVPGDATDLAPYIARGTADGTDGVVGFLIGSPEATLIQQLQASGYTGKLSTQAGLLTQDLLDQVEGAADGMLVVGSNTPYTSTKVKGIKMMHRDMQAFDPDLDLDDAAINAWASMWVFERVAATLPTIDRASVLEAMGKVEDLDMGGITPPLTTTTESTIPLLARMFNPTVVFSQVKDGKIVQTDKKFFDPFEGDFVSP